MEKKTAEKLETWHQDSLGVSPENEVFDRRATVSRKGVMTVVDIRFITSFATAIYNTNPTWQCNRLPTPPCLHNVLPHRRTLIMLTMNSRPFAIFQAGFFEWYTFVPRVFRNVVPFGLQSSNCFGCSSVRNFRLTTSLV